MSTEIRDALILRLVEAGFGEMAQEIESGTYPFSLTTPSLQVSAGVGAGLYRTQLKANMSSVQLMSHILGSTSVPELLTASQDIQKDAKNLVKAIGTLAESLRKNDPDKYGALKTIDVKMFGGEPVIGDTSTIGKRVGILVLSQWIQVSAKGAKARTLGDVIDTAAVLTLNDQYKKA